MCGIVGFLDTRPARTTDFTAVVTSMCDTLAHRGPDDSGTWTDKTEGIALGHRRLSIVDLSVLGHQPMHSLCGRYLITFNGEIYNFNDIRCELHGHAFRGASDTEVLLAAVAQWGVEGALARCNGMYAFALWDRVERRLSLARDRIGEKPLYYGWCGSTFMFGSELKALEAHPAFNCSVDQDALTQYFRYNYVPAPYSIYRGILKLRPGHLVEVKRQDPGVMPDSRPYWSAKTAVLNAINRPFRGNEQDAAAQLEDVLITAVKRRLYADVPIGAFLSGGIDSSTIVALMQSQTNKRVTTFTIGFGDEEFSEAPYARAVARHLGTQHVECILTADDITPLIQSLPELYDEPFADSSQLPTILVSRLARQSVSVVVTGDGGDELFGGYHRHFRNTWHQMERVPLPARRALAACALGLSKVPWPTLLLQARGGPPHRFMLDDKLYKLAAVLPSKTLEHFYLNLVSHWHAPLPLARASAEPATILSGRADRPALQSDAEKLMFLDLVGYLPDDILTKVDRATMAVALEARVPFLDPDVITFAWSLPLSMKVAMGQGKSILRAVLRNHVPPALTERRKAGFGIPMHSLLRGPLRAWAEELIYSRRLDQDGIIDPRPVRKRWKAFLHNREWQSSLWGVLMLQAWLERPGRPNHGVHASHSGPCNGDGCCERGVARSLAS